MVYPTTPRAQSIDKLRGMGKVVSVQISEQGLAAAICAAMSWAPRRDYDAVIQRFARHENGELAAARAPVRAARPLTLSPAMKEAVSRSRSMSFVTLKAGAKRPG
ncbi:MAG: hypothetical protein M0R28_14015 [Pigmentiphaga sp.]|nr:hypothetical protein [Pigmentiphaga sp.]